MRQRRSNKGLGLRRAVISLFLLLTGAFGLSACGSTSYLVHQEIVGGRHVKHLLKQSGIVTDGDGNKEQIFNYYVRICDLDAQGEPHNCGNSLVLRDVSGGGAQ